MAAFRAIFFAALVAGMVAGVATSLVQAAKLWPLIAMAETVEAASPRDQDHVHADEPHWSPSGPLRPALTVAFNIVAGLGFGLVLNAYIRARTIRTGRPFTTMDGIAWGGAGFVAFSLAPAFGLPPELPGMGGEALLERQLWWVGTAACTAAAIALFAYASWRWRAAALALIVLPHLIGAPHAGGSGQVPADMAAAFVAASLAASAIFWVVLGWASGWAQQRFTQTG